MTFLALSPSALALLALAAHFYRAQRPWIALALLLALPLLAVRRPWAARVLKILLYVGALVWVEVAWTLVSWRLEEDAPWLRLAAILGGVALFTLAAALSHQSRRLRAWFRLAPPAP